MIHTVTAPLIALLSYFHLWLLARGLTTHEVLNATRDGNFWRSKSAFGNESSNGLLTVVDRCIASGPLCLCDFAFAGHMRYMAAEDRAGDEEWYNPFDRGSVWL